MLINLWVRANVQKKTKWSTCAYEVTFAMTFVKLELYKSTFVKLFIQKYFLIVFFQRYTLFKSVFVGTFKIVSLPH